MNVQWNNAKRFANNAAVIIGHKSESFLQNPENFKKNALIMSSLALVLSRTTVTNFSAVKARNTPEGPFREREAKRTVMREWGGFTSSFVVLKTLEWAIKKGFRKALAIRETGGAIAYPFFRHLKTEFVNWGKPIADHPYLHAKTPINFGLDSAQTFEVGRLDWVMKQMKRVQKSPVEKAAAETLVKRVYAYAPMLLSSVVSIALGGYALERFTRDHSEAALRFFGGTPTESSGSGLPTGANTLPSLYPVGLSQTGSASTFNSTLPATSPNPWLTSSTAFPAATPAPLNVMPQQTMMPSPFQNPASLYNSPAPWQNAPSVIAPMPQWPRG